MSDNDQKENHDEDDIVDARILKHESLSRSPDSSDSHEFEDVEEAKVGEPAPSAGGREKVDWPVDTPISVRLKTR